MITTTTQMTALTPSGYVMSSTGAASGTGIAMTAARAKACLAPTFAVRDRHVSGVALAQESVPGSTAWSPPPC